MCTITSKESTREELTKLIFALTQEERKELLTMWKQARRTDATA